MKKILIIISSILLGILLLFSLRGNWERNKILKEEVTDLQKKESNLQKETGRLDKLITEGQKEASLEREVRSMLGFKKKGEKVVLVLPPTISNPATTTSEKTANTTFSFSKSLSKIRQIWYNLKQLLRRIPRP